MDSLTDIDGQVWVSPAVGPFGGTMTFLTAGKLGNSGDSNGWISSDAYTGTAGATRLTAAFWMADTVLGVADDVFVGLTNTSGQLHGIILIASGGNAGQVEIFKDSVGGVTMAPSGTVPIGAGFHLLRARCVLRQRDGLGAPLVGGRRAVHRGADGCLAPMSPCVGVPVNVPTPTPRGCVGTSTCPPPSSAYTTSLFGMPSIIPP